MSVCDSAVARAARRAVVGLAVLTSLAVFRPEAEAQAQQNLFGGNRQVGGILIGADGIVATATAAESAKLRQKLLEATTALPQGMDSQTEFRQISLRGIDEAIGQCLKDGKDVPMSIWCLAGLQRVDFVVADPERKDIVLAGPAEAWKIDERGTIVGANSGRAVMLLDDLIVALRSAHGTPSVLSCSIDPSEDGLQRLSNFARRIKPGIDPRAAALGFERQLGPQNVSVTGVPETSHYASVMVAADYRMKRMGMDIEPAPIPGLPGFMQMMQSSGRRASNMMPRWWLAPEYEAPLRDAQGLTWELRGGSVKVMTESEFLDAAGTRQSTGQVNPIAQKWADNMTARYDELALAEPIFGQLRNCIDLAVVGALIRRYDLVNRTQAGLPALLSPQGLQTAQLAAPKHVESKSTLARLGRQWAVACGGVQINPWNIIETAEETDALASVRNRSAEARSERWWD